ncbi:MAG TPA: dihydropteroate synthase [Caldithrix abyssi]|uniref:Dihydropteroate synthase n=1 Tax=Caldithrix abyssi TaxID=187145 RepID=A0A7V1LM45_CALAY|nr:dihydropteroate synthase [Caldithrix abyssi]
MGIVNVTPDSFSDGGRYFDPTAAMEHARRLIDEGSDVLDIGGESSRPGAEPVTAGEELRRVIPVIEGIRRFSDIPLSIDTYKSTVARAALDAGADIINDISGTEFDVQMAELVKEKRCPIVIMHMKGQPKTMQDAPEYREVVTEVYDYFEKKIKHLSSLNDGQIILDPGIGFGKRLEHNLSLIRQMRDFTFWGYPLLTGISRKSFLGEFLGLNVDERKHASKYVELITLMKGSSMIRTHDVREVVQIRKLFRALF